MITKLKAILVWWRCLGNKHVFRGPDLVPRNEAGNINWRCSKCGKNFTESYGLQLIEHGEILGPWGNVKPRKNKT